MQPLSDAGLLREYAENGKESAFAELTTRYTNLVYSAAVRQVDSPDLAAEIAQQVFIALARGAQALSPKLAADASLAGWLCRCARNLSLKLRRDEFRRLSRERQAMAQHDPAPQAPPDWEHLRGFLDEAMAELSETDYEAVVLRFYQQQDLRSVGRALGVSDDAAQKRVSRAVERLRECLAKRGVTIGAAALVALLSAHAVQAAPAGLALTAAAAAVLAGAQAAATTATTTAAATLTSGATKTIAMTLTQKTILAVGLAAAVGTGVFYVRHAAKQAAQKPQPQPALLAKAQPASAQPAPLAPDALPPTVPISLTSLLVPAENDQWDRSDIFKIMPRGKQTFGGVQFQLEGLIQLQSRASQEGNLDYRRSVTIPLTEATASAAGLQILQGGSNVAAVHLLGATRYEGEGESSLAQLIWHYADGATRTTDLRFDNHVRDWIRQPYEVPAFLPYTFSKVVWRAPVPKQEGLWVRLYRFSYPNPEPGRVLQQLELASTMQSPNLFVAGLSLDSVPLGQRPDDSPNLEPPNASSPAQITVAVQTPEGAPIPNARLQLMVQQVAGEFPKFYRHTQFTDSNGVAQINYPQPQHLQYLEIAAACQDYGARKMAWQPSAGNPIPATYLLKLAPGLTLGGFVVDEAEAPIAGAKLNFTRFYGNEDSLPRGEQGDFATSFTTSDPQGRWQLKGVAADLLGHMGIHAQHPGYVRTDYYGPDITPTMNQQLQAGTLKVVLRRGAQVLGRVLDDAEHPIPGALVTAGKPYFGTTQQTNTDAQGTFTFGPVYTGEVLVSVLAKGRQPAVRKVEAKPGLPEIVFHLGPGKLLRGLVKAETGEPLPGVRISLENPIGGVSETYQVELTSDDAGQFEWDGAPDEPQNFSFLKPGYETKRRQTLQATAENVVTLRPERKIQGWVLDATNGQPVTKFRVALGRGSPASPFFVNSPGMKADCTDPNGQFNLTASEADITTVKVEADDYAPQVQPLPEATNGVVQVVVRLQPSAGLRAVLVTADGAPVPAGSVAIPREQTPPTLSVRNNRLTSMGSQGQVATTDADGSFVLSSPPESGTVVALADAGFGQASIQQVRESGRLVLQPFGRIEGRVTHGGQPVAGQEFLLKLKDINLSLDFTQGKVSSDQDGRFAFDRVPPGAVSVVRLVKTGEVSWTQSYGADVTVLPGQTAQVALGDSGATLAGHMRFETPLGQDEKLELSGTLHTPMPQPPANLSNEERRAFYQSAEWKAQLKNIKTFAFNIADDGSWSLDSIPPGTYTVSISAYKPAAPGRFGAPAAYGSAQVVVPEGATPQTQLSVDEIVLRPRQLTRSPGP